jgi:transposase
VRRFAALVSVSLAAGEKKTSDGSDLRQKLIAFIDMHKAGSPTNADIYWISLSYKQLATKFHEHSGIQVSHSLVERLLNELGYRYRKPYKVLPTGVYAHRDAQF